MTTIEWHQWPLIKHTRGFDVSLVLSSVLPSSVQYLRQQLTKSFLLLFPGQSWCYLLVKLDYIGVLYLCEGIKHNPQLVLLCLELLGL